MIGWIVQRRSDGALFKVVDIGDLQQTWKMREIETGERLLLTSRRLSQSYRWSPVGRARSIFERS